MFKVKTSVPVDQPTPSELPPIRTRVEPSRSLLDQENPHEWNRAPTILETWRAQRQAAA